MAGAYKTGKYRNIFKEYGYPEEEIQKRVEDTFNTIFYGNDDERFYHEAGDDMGYMEDTGNHDVRTEGMSYGMMVCVQLDKKAEFEANMDLFHSYVRGGIEEMYEQFTDGCSTRDDYMNKLYEVLTTFRQEIAGLSYDEELAKLIG